MQEEAMEFSLEAPVQKDRSRRPLAERMRPQSLSEVLGQQHLLGDGCLLPKLIRENRVGNILLAGPPGTGKTTLATNLAGTYASQGARVTLADYDPQASSLAWLSARPTARPRILGVPAQPGEEPVLPRGATLCHGHS